MNYFIKNVPMNNRVIHEYDYNIFQRLDLTMGPKYAVPKLSQVGVTNECLQACLYLYSARLQMKSGIEQRIRAVFTK